jgi:hypothetical protein
MTAPQRARLTVVPDSPPPPPYDGDVRAKGWRFELDHERIEQSDTWALAPPELRPWLLMLWMVAWRQSPCGTLPDSDEIIAARIGMDRHQFTTHRAVLMRGWTLCADGRYYHDTIAERVRSMLEARRSEADRKRAWRDRQSPNVPRDTHGTPPGVTTPEPEPEPVPEEKLSPPTGGEGAASPPQHPADADAERMDAETETAARLPACPVVQILDLYHEQLPQLPRCLTLTDARRGYIRTRWREIGTKRRWATRAEGLDFFRRYFEFVGKSKFLTGRESGRDGKPPFEADLEWLMRPGNFAKVVEGKFHR